MVACCTTCFATLQKLPDCQTDPYANPGGRELPPRNHRAEYLQGLFENIRPPCLIRLRAEIEVGRTDSSYRLPSLVDRKERGGVPESVAFVNKCVRD